VRVANVPQSIATVVSAGLATYAELGTVLGTEDLQDLIEIAVVNAANARLADQQHPG